jgi:DNA-binding transcriptional LysR family regulator
MTWSSVELRQIRAFLALAEELHYARTAQRLGVTPSRVSQTIRTIEALVGGRLFDRTSRRVRLTAMGAQLYRDMAPMYAGLERAFAEAREMATGVAGILRLGMYTQVNGGPHLLEIVKAFQARYPSCRVQLIETGLTRNQLEWLRDREVDLLVMRMPVNDRAITAGPVLSREDRVVLVANDHPLAGRTSLRYDDLAEYPVPFNSSLPPEAMDAIIPPRTPSGRLMRRVAVHSLNEAVMRVTTGELVHPTVPSLLDHYPQAQVTSIPIIDLPPSETALIWLRDKPSVKVRAFAATAADVLRPPATAGRKVRSSATGQTNRSRPASAAAAALRTTRARE